MLTPETNLGSYRLIERIGAGGMGEVWKAEDSRLSRIVAIKILPPSVTANAEATARLRREARMAAQLNHPNIATIHSIEEAGERLFIVMEFVDGEPLTKVIRRGISEADLCRIGRSVAEALAEAHAKGIVHRDIKPDNVIVSGLRVKVLDFGIAKQVESSSPDAATAPFLTQQGMILGTIHYMSPEQALGKTLDARTDIFSLGVVLYEAATRRLPFQGETITETMTQIIRDEPPEPVAINASISPGLNAIIQRCMRKNREERFPTAGSLAHALEEQLGRASTARFTAAPPTVITAPRARAKRPVWPWAAAAALAIVLGAAWAMQRHVGPASTGSDGLKPVPHPAAPTQTVAPPPPAATSVTVPAPKIEEAPKAVGGLKPAAPQTAPPTADQLYEHGMALLSSGDWKNAQQTFHEAIKTDPHYARAHTRLGEIALFRRDFEPAGRQFEAALNDADRLTPHEQELSRLGRAIAARDREQATEIARGMMERWPNDPELQRLHREFPGMFMAPGGRMRRRGRGV